MTRKLEPILADILDRIGKIQAATKDKTFEDFEADWMLRFAVERGIENISEAVRHIPEETLEQQPQIPWSLVKGIGSVLRHEYHRIAPKVIWTVATQHLEPLRIAADRMQQSLSKMSPPQKPRKPS